MLSDHHMCPVCGYPELDEPPFDEHGCPSFNICPCCGTEFGYDDAIITHKQLRQKWLAKGAKWYSTVLTAPTDWTVTAQLAVANLPDCPSKIEPH